MTIQQFFDKYNGQGIDFDGAFGFQCMDLYQQYNKEVVGAPHIPANAHEVWERYPVDFYDRILNTPEGVPQMGDVIIWNKNVGGGFGHIAIIQKATVGNFMSFDQNWPTGTKCQFQIHDYKNVVGWLRPKSQMVTITQKELDEIRLARDTHYNDLQTSKQTIENLNKTIENKESELNLANTQVSSLEKELLLLKKENKMLLDQAKQVPIMTAELTTCEADRKAYLEENESLRRSVSQKDRRYDELVGNTPKLFLEWVLKRFRNEN